MIVVPVEFPGKLVCVAFVALTNIVKSEEVLFPPSSLMTFLTTVRDAVPGSGVGRSLLVMVQRRNSSGSAFPVHCSEKDAEY